MSSVLDNIRAGYEQLEKRVQLALKIQVGDAQRLRHIASEVTRFRSVAEPHRDVFSAAEFATLQLSLADMESALDRAALRSADPLTIPKLKVMEKRPNGKGTGRHRLEIKPQFLDSALKLRGPTGVAKSVGCSARTVRRRGLEAGVLVPGGPVWRHQVQPNGQIAQVRQSVASQISPISDDPEALDAQVADILQVFPNFGREMLSGALSARGFRVPRNRINASYLRVPGV
ncbi:hypothetical protein GGX14DRAFT_378361 [Mycena pura]|uniref:Uncharacterized protein n=1 Tax=Mycena pura TaxID=153505 RepID=A0AAD6UX08_9AGAR|nr:hypothetical protein GGX14DRAFT_378361 [Mycena pura]